MSRLYFTKVLLSVALVSARGLSAANDIHDISKMVSCCHTFAMSYFIGKVTLVGTSNLESVRGNVLKQQVILRALRYKHFWHDYRRNKMPWLLQIHSMLSCTMRQVEEWLPQSVLWVKHVSCICECVHVLWSVILYLPRPMYCGEKHRRVREWRLHCCVQAGLRMCRDFWYT